MRSSSNAAVKKGRTKRQLLMKFKVQFDSAVFNLRLLEFQKTMKKPNQYRILPNAKKISRLQFEFVAWPH
jgi:hypothetical protein